MGPSDRARTVEKEVRTVIDEVRALDAQLAARLASLMNERDRARDTEYLTSTEAAEAVGVSRNTIKKWARLGYLRHSYRTDGGHIRIPRREVDRVARLERLLTETPEPVGPATETDEASKVPWRS